MSFIKIDNLNIRLGNFHLKNCSLTVERGDYLIIIGPTGSGKSILLETIAGFYTPEKGKIFINGIDITNLPPEKRDMSIVYQDYMLFPNMTVFGNIAYGLKKKIKDKEKIKDEVNHIAKVLNIDHLLDRYPNTLSGGEMQRTAIARALVVKPKLLLMDEPFSALDVKTRSKLRSLVKNAIKEYNTTVLQITHDFEDIWSLANKVVVMKNGVMLQKGSLEEIFNKPSPNFVADFVGTNVLDAEIIGKDGDLTVLNVDNLTLYSYELDYNKHCNNGGYNKVKVSIRPENIVIENKNKDIYFKSERNERNERNVFIGKIKKIVNRGYIISLVVNVENIDFNVYITPNNIHSLNLKEGNEIYIIIKPENVRILYNSKNKIKN
ncbi:ATP-binding cassette domain-containing protein [Methanothermococcus sp.]|uniref:ATP-binding cassette domain-containing protein n=1 Tax=Methanothermococcus sp. TaxID=2614238 RepID=UPI0026000CDB|nr:ATP-binding cassette domain-containing protein [Methanothermococcus sp.]